jgi:hypothetical protein
MSDQQQSLTMNAEAFGIPPVKSESQLSEMSADMTERTDLSDDSSFSDGDRRVSFGVIQVREYERLVGDHPDTRIGVPLTIGWGFIEHDKTPIDKYESERSSKGNLRMSSITRKNILHNVFGVPEDELRAAEKEVQKIKKSRERSKKQSNLSAKSESALKVLGKRAKNFLSAEAFMKGVSSMASYGMVMHMSNH